MVQNSTVNQLGNKWRIQLLSQVLPHLNHRNAGGHARGGPHLLPLFFPGLCHFDRHARGLWATGMLKNHISFKSKVTDPFIFQGGLHRSMEAEFPLSPVRRC